MSKFKSPEESGEGQRPARGGRELREEGGFCDGEYGRGSTPYKRSHSSKPDGHSLEAHDGTSGRGGSGIIGRGDGYKNHSEDIEHPATHAEFEALGTDGGSSIGGRG